MAKDLVNKRAEARLAMLERLVDASEHLTAQERAELVEWERKHVTGDAKFGTSDWPGWPAVIARLQH